MAARSASGLELTIRSSAATIVKAPDKAIASGIQKRHDGNRRVMAQANSPTNNGAQLDRNVAPPAVVCKTAMLYSPTSPAKNAPPRKAKPNVDTLTRGSLVRENSRNSQSAMEAKKTR